MVETGKAKAAFSSFKILGRNIQQQKEGTKEEDDLEVGKGLLPSQYADLIKVGRPNF